MECVPMVSAEVVSEVVPEVSATGLPRLAMPSMNWIAPVGLVPVTVAVKVTDCPTMIGSTEATSVVAVGALVEMNSESAGEVLGELRASPLYAAVIECVPTAKVEVVNVATLPIKATGVASEVAPSKNCTLPVGLSPETTAVKVTGWPKEACPAEETTAVIVGASETVSFSAEDVLVALELSPL